MMPQPTSEVTVIRPQNQNTVHERLHELWSFRELLWVLVRRNISVRFAQTSLGIAWVILQPLLMTATFTFIFTYLVQVPKTDTPYPVLAFSGLLLWQYFGRCVSEGGAALQNHAHMISKVYFPRLLLLMVPMLAATVDVLICLTILLCMLAWHDLFPFGISLLALPLIVLGTGVLGFSISLVLAPLGVRRRDIMVALPFLLQLGMYVTPVIYPLEFVPDRLKWLFYLNPMATLTEGMRWILLGSTPPPGLAWLTMGIIILFLLTIGNKLFEQAQANMVDKL